MYLEAYNSTVIRDITVDTSLQTTTNSWDVNLKIYFENTPNNRTVKGTVAINLKTDVTTISELFYVVLTNNEYGDLVTTVNFTIPTVSSFF